MPLPVEFISQKRDGRRHDDDALRDWIHDFAGGRVPDYQMAAWTMAVYLRGMTDDETAVLTRSMLETGDTLAWFNRDERPVVDKHSTGGVGDKVSLILAPLLACCGLRVPMISGRGLGPTGGTLDKLESIPGLETQLPNDRIQQIANEVGCVIAGAGPKIAPADRKLYALRDVTGTVASIPLITASIMSKKLAEGLDALVLDVKCGSGAFMKTLEEARRLAASLVAAGAAMGVATSALITDMNQPLGRWVGNAVEVNEAQQCLQGHGPDDLVEATVALGNELLADAGESPPEGRLQRLLDDGSAWETFERMAQAQGGDAAATRPLAPARDVCALHGGYVARIDTEAIGFAVINLGGGRRVKTDVVDFGVGLKMLVRVGDQVQPGQPLVQVLSRSDQDHQRAAKALLQAIQLTDEPPSPPPLIHQQWKPAA